MSACSNSFLEALINIKISNSTLHDLNDHKSRLGPAMELEVESCLSISKHGEVRTQSNLQLIRVC